MVIGDSPQYAGRIYRAVAVQCQEKLARRSDPLQPVEPIGHRHGGLRCRRNVVVPACPSATPTRQYRGICVQQSLVALVGERSKNRHLSRSWLGEDFQSLVSVDRDNDVVEPFRQGLPSNHCDVVATADQLLNRTVGSHVETGAIVAWPRCSEPSPQTRSAIGGGPSGTIIRDSHKTARNTSRGIRASGSVAPTRRRPPWGSNSVPRSLGQSPRVRRTLPASIDVQRPRGVPASTD